MAITAKIGKRKTWTVKVGAYNGGTNDHSKLFNRDSDNQHPMSAISGLKTFAENTNAHMGSKENPHGVTAAQVGARPNTWMPTAAQVGAAPAGYGLGADGRIVTDCNLATANGWYIPTADAENRPGSWGGWMFVASRYGTMVVQDFYAAVTPIQHYWRYGINGNWSEWVNVSPAAFAPAGYGLGENQGKYLNASSDLNNATVIGWYYIVGDNPTNAPSGVACGNAILRVERSATSGVIEQTLYLGTAGMQGLMLRRYYHNGLSAWQPWEWVNPPMVAGTEYRTTERWNGKPVYKQTISLGKLPESTTKFENLLIADEVVDFSFTTTDNTSEKFIHNNKVTALGRAWSSQYIYATIELNSVLSQYYGYLTISYTKL